MTTYNTHTLPNGLRIIHRPSDADVVYCGYAIGAGSRHEAPGDEGLAHFCEHVSFKGTRRRSALQILNCLERVGGDLNAFTNKEDTVYHAAIQSRHIRRAVGLLSDIVFHSVYPEEEARREVEVICDEIESYNDSPAELIYDRFDNLVFSGHPLGHNILGSSDRVRAYTSDDARRFTRRHYRPDNAIFFAYGKLDFDRLVKWLEASELSENSENSEHPEPSENSERPENSENSEPSENSECPENSEHPENSENSEPSENSENPEPSENPESPENSENSESSENSEPSAPHHQAHVMLGTRAYSHNDERRTALYLLNNILGGPGMNARLNLSLRERNGLVYTVESSMASYSDAGVWTTYFGCDHADVNRCLRLVRRELDRVMQRPLSDRQLEAAKRQLKGQIAIAADNREQSVLDLARGFLHYGRTNDTAAFCERIDALTAQQLQDVAQETFEPARLMHLVI